METQQPSPFLKDASFKFIISDCINYVDFSNFYDDIRNNATNDLLSSATALNILTLEYIILRFLAPKKHGR